MTTGSTSRSRAGRLDLLARLAMATKGAELLHSKEEVLQREQARLAGHVARTEKQWVQSCADAATWLMRARALGAGAELTAIVERGSEPATVTPHWNVSMGVSYPGDVDYTPAPDPIIGSTAALRPTVDAYRTALRAAAAHASSTAALDRVRAELDNTRRRRRAIEQRLVPRLESTIHRLDLYLDEQDRDEAFRVHMATEQQKSARR